MFLFKERSVSIMVAYAVILHLVWAVAILIDPQSVNATAVHALHRLLHSPQNVALTAGLCSVLAGIGMATRMPWLALLLIPQQILLMISAAGSFEAMWLSQYADGIFRARAFIIVDQVPVVLAALGHSVAIFAHIWRRVR